MADTEALPLFGPLPPFAPRVYPPRPAAMLDPDTSWTAGREDAPRKSEYRSRLRREILRLHQAHPDGTFVAKLKAAADTDAGRLHIEVSKCQATDWEVVAAR